MANLTFSLSTLKWCYIILLLDNYGMKKGTFTSCVVQYNPAAVLYYTLLDRILR